MHAQAAPVAGSAPTHNRKLLAWVDEVVRLAQPDRVCWCDGSEPEWRRMTDELVESGALVRLDARPE